MIYTGIPLASRASRFIAHLLDGLIMTFAVLAVFLPQVFAIFSGREEAASFADLSRQWFLIVFCIAMFLFIAFFQFVLLSTQGQTIGKKIMRIKIVHAETGQNAGFVHNVLLRAFLNGFLSLIPFYGLVDVLFIFRDDRRCIHDLLASTIVVEAEPDEQSHVGMAIVLLLTMPALISAGWMLYMRSDTPPEVLTPPVVEDAQQSSHDVMQQEIDRINQRNAKRRADVNILTAALRLYSEEHPGMLLKNIPTVPIGICRTNAPHCDGLVDLSVFVPTYMLSIPVDPLSDDPRSTGYTIRKDHNDVVSVEAPLAEDEIILIKE